MNGIENEVAYQAAIDRKIRQACAAKWTQFKLDRPDVDWDRLDYAADRSAFVCNVMDAGRKYGKISDNQLAALVNFLAMIDARRAEAAELKAAGVGVPAGVHVVQGTVKTLKTYMTAVTPWQNVETTKMLVETNEGWKMYATVPAAIIDDVEIGTFVEFTAELVPSREDAMFATGKRPRKAKLLQVA